ncbi:MAG TPA: type IV toxin-antitoxin system AbiEi family antitoxin domain-containing protein [Anaerolineales bacterium]|nr:type IV toxin-antitoxin system AbiEi family antitoxin domain-containing protein [Anaerolineales bacterium]
MTIPRRFEKAIQVFSQNNGILRTAQSIRLGVDQKTLAEMLEKGLIVREARGIYRLANLSPLANPDLIQVALRIPSAVICLLSALAIHNLTTQIPHKVYIALPSDTKKPRIIHPPLKIFWLSPRPYSAGIQKHLLDGIPVPVYNREKTIADCFKFRNEIGPDIALEALKDYIRLPDHDFDKLLHYAEITRVLNVMRPYVRALA